MEILHLTIVKHNMYNIGGVADFRQQPLMLFKVTMRLNIRFCENTRERLL